MENGPFIDGLPIKNWDFPWLLQMLNNQRVYIFIYIHNKYVYLIIDPKVNSSDIAFWDGQGWLYPNGFLPSRGVLK
jgi:hypothetical protein